MRTLLIAAALAALGTSAASAPARHTVAPGATEALRLAETALDAELKDYSSARFRDVRVEQADPWTVCGFVNSKNSYGGYVGWQQFYFLPVPKAPNGGALMVASDEALTKVIGDSCADPKTVWMKTDFSTRLQPAK